MTSVPNLILFTAGGSSSLTDRLAQAGFRVFEAIAISEVLHLCETESVDIILITAEIEEHRTHEIQHRYMTLRLKPETALKEIIAELWRLFPDKTSMIQ